MFGDFAVGKAIPSPSASSMIWSGATQAVFERLH
jgi:hypothetical protein